MQVRLIPYSEVFVSVTLNTDEATALMDGLEVASNGMPQEVQKVVGTLRAELEAALRRAASIILKKEG